MTTDTEHATRVFGLTHGADLKHVIQEFADARAEEHARVLDELKDDLALAGIMRRLLGPEVNHYIGYAARGERWAGPPWLTIDVRQFELSDEEFAAVEKAGMP